MQLLDFTTPLASGVKEIVVTAKDAPPIATLDDLAGRTVYVRPQSARETHLRELSDRLVAKGLAPIDVQLAPPELEPEDLLEMVNAGLMPAIVVNRYYATFWAQVFPEIVVREDLVVAEGQDVGFAMRKGSAFGNILANKYFKGTKWVKNAANEAEMAKFRALIDFFRRYGEEYGVDWTLMAAQGYQESRLDQSVRSPVGAIGVMQVMPETGKSMRVGDITKVEPNIHAGTKFLRAMVNEYYAKEPMDQKNKMLFAFASYNAGPGRVAGLRKEAATRGLDPNVWFNNVELMAAEKVGRETVTYVSNIYKYYLAYQMIEEQRAEREKTKAETREGANK